MEDPKLFKCWCKSKINLKYVAILRKYHRHIDAKVKVLYQPMLLPVSRSVQGKYHWQLVILGAHSHPVILFVELVFLLFWDVRLEVPRGLPLCWHRDSVSNLWRFVGGECLSKFTSLKPEYVIDVHFRLYATIFHLHISQGLKYSVLFGAFPLSLFSVLIFTIYTTLYYEKYIVATGYGTCVSLSGHHATLFCV